jgi:hypothetical protein
MCSNRCINSCHLDFDNSLEFILGQLVRVTINFMVWGLVVWSLTPHHCLSSSMYARFHSDYVVWIVLKGADGKPIYIGLKRDVFDVSAANDFYGVGSG